MRKTEKIFAILLLTAIIFKFTLIPGGGILCVLVSLLLFMIYPFFGLSILYKIRLSKIFNSRSYVDISNFQVFFTVLSSFGLSLLVLGNLFKLQYWPGANLILIIGITSCSIFSLFSYLKYNELTFNLFKPFLVRSLIIGGLSIGLLVISTEEMEKFKYRNHPLYLKAYNEYLKNPDDYTLQYNLEKEQVRAVNGQETYDIIYGKD